MLRGVAPAVWRGPPLFRGCRTECVAGRLVPRRAGAANSLLKETSNRRVALDRAARASKGGAAPVREQYTRSEGVSCIRIGCTASTSLIAGGRTGSRASDKGTPRPDSGQSTRSPPAVSSPPDQTPRGGAPCKLRNHRGTRPSGASEPHPGVTRHSAPQCAKHRMCPVRPTRSVLRAAFMSIGVRVAGVADAACPKETLGHETRDGRGIRPA